MKIMWNSRKCAAMAIAGAGLAFAAAMPASAQWGGYYGSVGCGSYYGAAFGPGSLGCGDYGYAGTFTYGWPYASYVGGTGFGSGFGTGFGFGGAPTYGYTPGYGYGFGASPACGLGYGYAPAYGYGYSYAPAYGYGGFGCGRAHHRGRGYGYATAYHRSYGYAVASYRGHHHNAFAFAPVRSLRVAAARHHQKVQSRIASHLNLQFARAD
jgi:hypothetical protein